LKEDFHIAIFDKVGNKVSNFAKNAADKTGDMIETARLNSKIISEENVIDGLKVKIGEYYLQKFEAGEHLDVDVMELCAEIQGIKANIAAIKTEISAIKAGKDDEPAAASPAEETIFCPNCGASLPSGTKFCGQCGAQL